MGPITKALLAIQLITFVSATVEERAMIGTCSWPSCAQQAKTSQWVVEKFSYNGSYIFSTPAHQNSHGYISFELWNTAVPSITSTCSATSSQLTDFFYGNQWYSCTLPTAVSGGAAVSFRFNRPTGQLEVNGTIICSDDGKGSAAGFQVEATTKLALACTDTMWTNPNWTLASGQFYSDREVKCVPECLV